MDAKQAIDVAKAELASLFGSDQIQEIELEEVERLKDKWFVTMSFVRPSREKEQGKLANYLPPEWRREKRVITVHRSGDVLGITNYKPIGAQ